MALDLLGSLDKATFALSIAFCVLSFSQLSLIVYLLQRGAFRSSNRQSFALCLIVVTGCLTVHYGLAAGIAAHPDRQANKTLIAVSDLNRRLADVVYFIAIIVPVYRLHVALGVYSGQGRNHFSITPYDTIKRPKSIEEKPKNRARTAYGLNLALIFLLFIVAIIRAVLHVKWRYHYIGPFPPPSLSNSGGTKAYQISSHFDIAIFTLLTLTFLTFVIMTWKTANRRSPSLGHDDGQPGSDAHLSRSRMAAFRRFIITVCPLLLAQASFQLSSHIAIYAPRRTAGGTAPALDLTSIAFEGVVFFALVSLALHQGIADAVDIDEQPPSNLIQISTSANQRDALPISIEPSNSSGSYPSTSKEM